MRLVNLWDYMRRILMWTICFFFILSIPSVIADESNDMDGFSEENGGDDCPDVWGSSDS